MNTKRIALIGLKHMGTEHYTSLIQLAGTGRLAIQALCDTDSAALALPPVRRDVHEIEMMLSNSRTLSKRDRLGLLHEKMLQVCNDRPALYADYRDMLTKEPLDGIIVVTPNHLHREMVELALSKDINTLCEKPLAPTVADCDAMLEAERRSAAFLQVGLHMRYRKLCHFVKQLIDAKRIGDIKMMWSQEFRGDWNPDGTKVDDKSGRATNWRYLEQQSGGSIVEKLCHDLDLFAWWVGCPPRQVFAYGGKAVYTQRETIDHAAITVEYTNGAKLTITLCMFAPNSRFKGRYMGVVGDGGVLDLDIHSSSCTVYLRSGRVENYDNIEEQTKAGFHPGNASFLQLVAFLDCMDNGKKPFADSQIGRDSVAVGVAAQESLRDGRVVDL